MVVGWTGSELLILCFVTLLYLYTLNTLEIVVSQQGPTINRRQRGKVWPVSWSRDVIGLPGGPAWLISL
jgi:hypothetical protein